MAHGVVPNLRFGAFCAVVHEAATGMTPCQLGLLTPCQLGLLSTTTFHFPAGPICPHNNKEYERDLRLDH